MSAKTALLPQSATHTTLARCARTCAHARCITGGRAQAPAAHTYPVPPKKQGNCVICWVCMLSGSPSSTASALAMPSASGTAGLHFTCSHAGHTRRQAEAQEGGHAGAYQTHGQAIHTHAHTCRQTLERGCAACCAAASRPCMTDRRHPPKSCFDALLQYQHSSAARLCTHTHAHIHTRTHTHAHT